MGNNDLVVKMLGEIPIIWREVRVRAEWVI